MNILKIFDKKNSKDNSSDVSFGISANEEQISVKEQKKTAEEDVMIKCPKCGKMVNREVVVKHKYVCYECGSYFRVKAKNRISMVADPHTFEQWFEHTEIENPLSFEGYEEKLMKAKNDTGLDEAVTIGQCKVFGEDIVLGVCDSRFLMSNFDSELSVS